jgi:hypothetical protein
MPSATQHVTAPAAVLTRGSADDGREGKDEQPLLPSIPGGTLCASNGPLHCLQNPQSEALLIKNKPKTKHHKTKETRNRELFRRAGLSIRVSFKYLCREQDKNKLSYGVYPCASIARTDTHTVNTNISYRDR